MKKTKILISAILAFTMLLGCSASAAEIFQWIIEPSLAYEYVYYDNDNFYEGYWQLGDSYEDYNIVDSYGNTLLKDAGEYYYGDGNKQILGDYIVTKKSDEKYSVSTISGEVLFTTKYTVSNILNDELFLISKVEKENPDDWWGTYYYGAIDKSGNVIVKPQYNYLMDVGYNNWVMCGNEKFGIVDSKGKIVYDVKYNEVTYNDYMIACVGSPSNNNVIIDKETGKKTELNGDVRIYYGNFNWPSYNTDEFLYKGNLMNSKGELLSKKTEKIIKKFNELIGGSENYSHVLDGETGSYGYIGNKCYIVSIDEYTDNSRIYCVNENGKVIADGFSNMYEYSPGYYLVERYSDGESKTCIIDSEGNKVFPEKNGWLSYVSDSFVSIWDYENGKDKLYDIKGNKIGEYDVIMAEGDYLLMKKDGKVGFAKVINLPDGVDISKRIILFAGEKDSYIFGKYKANDVKTIIRNNRTMVPIRSVAEALGAEVSWNADKKEVKIKDEDTSIRIVIGKSKATVNGKELAIDSPAFIENGRTYLPVRFVSEALGAEVSWDAKTQAVIIK